MLTNQNQLIQKHCYSKPFAMRQKRKTSLRSKLSYYIRNYLITSNIQLSSQNTIRQKIHRNLRQTLRTAASYQHSTTNVLRILEIQREPLKGSLSSRRQLKSQALRRSIERHSLRRSQPLQFLDVPLLYYNSLVSTTI